jgi:hypothetical protein
MDFSVTDFRKAMPEFQDPGKYPDSLILGWATFAEKMVDCRRWKSSTLLGIRLYVAHEITLESQSIAAAAIGGTPGQQNGVVNTKTVGSVTVGYDTQSVSEKDAGWWNLTTYGKQFIHLARIFGAGCVQL